MNIQYCERNIGLELEYRQDIIWEGVGELINLFVLCHFCVWVLVSAKDRVGSWSSEAIYELGLLVFQAFLIVEKRTLKSAPQEPQLDYSLNPPTTKTEVECRPEMNEARKAARQPKLGARHFTARIPGYKNRSKRWNSYFKFYFRDEVSTTPKHIQSQPFNKSLAWIGRRY